jgi:aryl-alcohol dehydrogenase-like predicted oxidoreductase
MEAQCHVVLDAAWKLGVRYFDAARSYGRAEEFLASWLATRQSARGQLILGSKWGYTYTADWRVQAEHHEIKNHSLALLQKQVQESRGHLGQYLALYQIHSATLESGVLKNLQVLEALHGLHEEGLYIGLSSSGPKQAETIRRALEIRVAGRRLFDCVQATWNILDPSAGRTLQAAHDAGVGVIVKEALANGRLTTRNQEPEFSARKQLLEQEAARLGTTIDALALAAVLAQPWADVVLSGAATVEQLESNIAGLKVVSDARVRAQLVSLAETPEEYWKRRAELAWN